MTGQRKERGFEKLEENGKSSERVGSVEKILNGERDKGKQQ